MDGNGEQLRLEKIKMQLSSVFEKLYMQTHCWYGYIRLKYCKPPPPAKTVLIGKKRKRGRPVKAKPALPVQ